MKISFVLKEKPSDIRTGVQRYYDQLVDKLGELNELDIYYYGQISISQRSKYESKGTLTNLKSSRRSMFGSMLLRGLSDLSAIVRYDQIVHALLPVPMKLKRGAVLVTTIHDLTPLMVPEAFPFYTPYLFKKNLKALAKSNTYFIVNSQCTGNDLQKKFSVDPSRIFHTPLGVGEEFKPANDIVIKDVLIKYKLPQKYFLFTGAMNKRKNLDRVIEAFLLLKKNKNTDIKLVLAGRMNWGGSNIEEKVKKAGVKNDVILPGYIDEVDLPAVISAAKAMVYVSLYEGFGFPVLEAMKCGTPVIASNTSSIPEVAGDAALLVDPLSVEAITGAMEKIEEAGEEITDLISKGFKQAEQFTWENTANKTIEVYKSLLQQKKKS
ncbi:MAG: glycosyl transferase family 1 [Crocinitomicaceae bacterium]|nr:glycosyl transferase family 1 [Crocinitomicaceae bacterium]|tara:strand:+ start:4384 stop:5520 length:1137 start_codon:yes stop_codon:yes gene_type:complete